MTTLLAVFEGRMRDETPSVHLASDRVAAFLDSRLTGAERDAAVRHLTECAECRAELTALRAVLDTARERRPHRWIAAATAVAAILAFAMLPRLVGSDAENPTVGLTRAENGVRTAAGVGEIAIHSPHDGATVARDGLTLVWYPVGVGARYDVVVQDSTGGTAWRVRVSDTSVVLPDSARLTSGARYFWSVDARLADGRTIKTTVRFTIR